MGFSSGKTAPTNINLTDSQTLSNKTLDGTTVIQDGATITTPDIISPSRLDVKKDTLSALQTYASTAANGQMCFATDTKQMFQVIDSALAEVSGGSGGINHIENGDYNQDTTGTTGDTNLTVSQVNSSVEPTKVLRGDGSLKILKGAIDASTQSVTIPFTIDKADLAQKLTISFDKDFSDGNYADGDAQVRVIKDPAGSPVTIRVNGEDILGGKNSHIAQFQTDATELDYALEIYWNDSIKTTAVSAYMDNIQVGPREVVKGTPDRKHYSEANSDFTVTGTNWTTTTAVAVPYKTKNGQWRMTFNIEGSLSAGATLIDLTMSGITNTTSQSISGGQRNIVSGPTNFAMARNDSTFRLGSDTSSTLYLCSGDILIDSKPTWAEEQSDLIMSEDLGQREVAVEATGSVGSRGVLTASADKIDWLVTTDTTSSFDGETFTAPETGYYIINGVADFTTQIITPSIKLYINNSNTKYIGTTVTSEFRVSFATTEYLIKGDTVDFRCSDDVTLATGTALHWLNINKLASPQTILETETVAVRATSSDGQALTTTEEVITFEEVDFDTHGGMNTTTGEYTIPVTGIYQINAHLHTGGGDPSIGRFDIEILVNNALKSFATNKATTGLAGFTTQISDLLQLNKGDIIKINTDVDNNTNLEVDSAHNFLSIYRIK